MEEHKFKEEEEVYYITSDDIYPVDLKIGKISIITNYENNVYHNIYPDSFIPEDHIFRSRDEYLKWTFKKTQEERNKLNDNMISIIREGIDLHNKKT